MSKNKKKGGGIGSVITTLVLIAAIAVFCYAAWTLYGYYREYKAGTDEYSKLENAFTSMEDGQSDGESADGSSGAAAEVEAVTESMSEGGAAAGDGAADAASASGGVYEPEQHGETGKSGIVLKRVEDLEDPDTLEEKVEQAAAVDTEENREKKRLPLMRNPIDFAQLQEINPEIIGWIRIGALDKSYPVAQAKDNDFYLHRTFEKKDNFAGCIFLNCDNSRFFTDQNSVVYGHNMKNGSMFGTLRNFTDQATYDKNPYFWIFTPQYIYQYQIFSCSIVSKIGDPYRTRFTTKDFEQFLKKCVESSQVKARGPEPEATDRIVTLSTCTGDDSTRFIAQGVLRQIYLSR